MCKGGAAMRKKECLAMILAGGKGSRLGVLTKNVAKPAVLFGGKYRIIDFTLSNCRNSGIETVGILATEAVGTWIRNMEGSLSCRRI